mmetsp:Transcript_1650/g.2514  ORF Transcript_1650/g.2514 Transcript_1650/m.2514 type:complete len:86 (-) Transcript_1650:10-267(-)
MRFLLSGLSVVEDCSGCGFQQYVQANKMLYKRWPKDLQTTLSIVEQVAFVSSHEDSVIQRLRWFSVLCACSEISKDSRRTHTSQS